MNTVEYGKQNSEVIILLHGGGLSWWNFRSQAELLSGRFRVVLPVLDGHAGSDADFTSIADNARRVVSYVEREHGGSVLLIGGVSLGAQILTEALALRGDICRYAVIESARVIPSRLMSAAIGPATASSYGLIRKQWFAKAQFRSLHMRGDLFDDYYRDTVKISKENMIAFLKANTAYEPDPRIKNCRADTRVIVGGKEQKNMLRSAGLLCQSLPGSRLEIKDGLYHGEYSLNRPEEYVKDILEMTG